MEKTSSILVTGATGMVGGAFARALKANAYQNVLTPTRKELDLMNESHTVQYVAKHRPEYVFMIAAKVGGIGANMKDKYGFLAENFAMTSNLFNAVLKTPPKKCLYFGSSCVYPAQSPQPMKEEYLLQGPVEPTNEGYALAKIAGLKMAQYLHKEKGLLTVCPMPCNLYGTGDHFDLEKAHVLSSLVKKFVDAKKNHSPSVTLWGDGSARREFLHVDDMVRALFFFIESIETSEIINVGSGQDVTIKELAELIREKVGFTGELVWDTSRPNGMLKKCLDVTKLRALGFNADVSLEDGITRTIAEYKTIIGTA
jgi:GDP-L-fucose synthase